MSGTNEFIIELVRAANDIDKLNDHETRRLLERSATTIRHIREQIHRWPVPNVRDAVVGLDRSAAIIGAGQAGPDLKRAALLDAATMIRDLHVVLDSGTEISVTSV
jgi:hypothetical protein